MIPLMFHFSSRHDTTEFSQREARSNRFASETRAGSGQTGQTRDGTEDNVIISV
jgi:hypothetical protein